MLRSRKARNMLATLAVIMGSSIGWGATPAAADGYGQTFQNRATGACLDDSLAYGTRTVFPCNGMTFQKWDVHNWGDGTVTLKNQNTGRCLTGGGNAVYSVSCDGSLDNYWYVIHWRDGGLTFKNQASRNCLDDSFEAHLRMFHCAPAGTQSPYQSWY